MLYYVICYIMLYAILYDIIIWYYYIILFLFLYDIIIYYQRLINLQYRSIFSRQICEDSWDHRSHIEIRSERVVAVGIDTVSGCEILTFSNIYTYIWYIYYIHHIIYVTQDQHCHLNTSYLLHYIMYYIIYYKCHYHIILY